VDKPIDILLADDDMDDRFFFNKALQALPFSIELKTVDNGEKLMTYLSNAADNFPDILFLDLNMPRKNGEECLTEIKLDPKLRKLRVIIYSTSINETVADNLYKKGAHNYVPKQELPQLIDILRQAITMIVANKFSQPNRDNFILRPTAQREY
jgi:CheY-like chemotaxis protein